MIDVLVLYRGRTLGGVKTVAISTDPALIKEFAQLMIVEKKHEPYRVLREINKGQQKALQLLADK